MVGQTDTVEYWTELACEVWKKISRRDYSCQFAVYVADDVRLEWCKIGGPAERRHTINYGHGLVGIYDRGVQLGWFVQDVIFTVRELGIIYSHEELLPGNVHDSYWPPEEDEP